MNKEIKKEMKKVSNKENRESIKRKISEVEKITKKCKESNTIAISSIESIPARMFQELRKRFRKDIAMKVIKRNLTERVFENLGLDIKEAKEYITKPYVFIITNLDVFSLASLLEENKVPSFLKSNQLVEKDVIIQQGITDLPPTAIADLSKAGLKVSIEKGKVAIKEKRVIKKGERINDALADALQKLDIKPLKVGLNVNLGIDLKNKKVYKNLIIDKEEEKERLRLAAARALNLALNIDYACKKTIVPLIQRAASYANSLNKFIENKRK